jgi:predicted nucleic acid-binding Zn ribbon protein
MPMYVWNCQVCGKQYDVIRKVHDIEVPPNEEDFKDSKYKLCECFDGKRQKCARVHVKFPLGWAGKGSW